MEIGKENYKAKGHSKKVNADQIILITKIYKKGDWRILMIILPGNLVILNTNLLNQKRDVPMKIGSSWAGSNVKVVHLGLQYNLSQIWKDITKKIENDYKKLSLKIRGPSISKDML